MRAFLIALMLALTAAGAAGQGTPPPAGESPPDRSADLRKEGDALLFAARAQDLFDNETHEHGATAIVLRHRASGFICLFEPGQPLNSVAVYPNAHRGDDVGCNTMTKIGDRTTNFTRDSHTDDQLIASAAGMIQRRIPSATPAPERTLVRPFATMFKNVPTPKSARFVTADTLEEVISAHVDGWLVEDRFTAPRSLATSNTIDAIWYITVAEGLHHRDMAATPGKSALVPPASGSGPSQASAPATPAEIAAARKDGDRILLGGHVQALFDNVTDGKAIALRHKSSGVVCRFDPGVGGAIVLGPAPGASQRPDAVNCVSGMGAFHNTLTLISDRDRVTPAQALADAVAATRGLYAGLVPFTGKGLGMNTGPSMPPHVSARMTSPAGSDQFYVYVSAAVVRGWIVTEQVVGPSAQAMTGDVVGEISIITATSEIAKATPAGSPGGPAGT